MHDIKVLKKHIDDFVKKLKDRNINLDKKYILDLDSKNRELIQKKEKLEQEKKAISQSKDRSKFDRSKEISILIDQLNKNQNETKKLLDSYISTLPNLALDSVPVGKDEKLNIEVKKKEI